VIHPDTNSSEHERFRELAAAMTRGALTAQECAELEYHLHECEPCHSVFREYQILASDGFALLARSYEHNEASGKWNEGASRRRLLSTAEELRNLGSSATVRPADRRVMGPLNSTGALAASLLLAVGIGAWQLSNWYRDRATVSGVSLQVRPAQVVSADSTVVSPIAVQSDDLARLQAESAAQRLAFEQLQSRFQDLQDERAAARAEIKELTQTKIDSESRLNQASMQRDQSLEQLTKAHQAYDLIAAELASLRAERDKVKLQLANVETRIGELTALNQEQERRLRDNEQYLSSDRDIRDLMSARNLYIADVFDVDGHSHTRKPFGRVFFTRGKSLLFYAFDLDQQSHLQSASTFQVWGERETVQNETARPIDLGILYLDSEANRRWSLHFDNPQTLSEIDAVFVTVEPNGGSLKPTGRPFLFATLQKQANHP
jgi:hypothetical protein